MLTPDERSAAEAIFRAHGFAAPLQIASSQGDDERIFVMPPDALAALPHPAITEELQRVLGRKVWLVAQGPEWPRTEPLR